MMLTATLLAQAAAPPPILLALTTTQVVVALLVGVITIVVAAFAFGRLSERQRSDRTALHATLDTLSEGMKGITEQLKTIDRQHQETREARVDWNRWRETKEEQDGDRDEAIADLEKRNADHHTRLMLIEERRSGHDRRQET